MATLTEQSAPGTMDMSMDSSSCVLRERLVTYVLDKAIQATMEYRNNIVPLVMARKLGNMVMCGAGIFIDKKGCLMGYVILPKADGLEARGKFTIRTAGTPAGLEVKLMKFAEVKVLKDKYLERHQLDISHLEESALYKMEVCEYSQTEFREKYLKTSNVRKEPHYEIQIDVEVSQGRKELMLSQARRDILVKDVSQLLEDRGSSDMVIECQGELVPCHRAVLVARSATFAGGLGHDFVEKKDGRWEVKEASLAAVRDMLSYIYTGDLPQGLQDRATELLQLASLYQLPELLEAARLQLVSQLSKDNAVRILVELDKHCLDLEDGAKTKEQVLKYIKDNVMEVVKGPDWKEFEKSYGNLVTEILLA